MSAFGCRQVGTTSAGAASSSGYTAALALTLQAIIRRARHYRNLVIVVALLCGGSIGWALMSWTLQPLAGILLLFPICGLFTLWDDLLLRTWRCQLFHDWTKGAMYFHAFRAAVNAVPNLPTTTLHGMLGTLPSFTGIRAEGEISSTTRHAIAATMTTIDTCRVDVVACKTAGYAIGAGAALLAAVFHTWYVVLAGGIAFLALPLSIAVRQYRLRTARRCMCKAQNEIGFNAKAYTRYMAENLDDSVPVKYRRLLLDLIPWTIENSTPGP